MNKDVIAVIFCAQRTESDDDGYAKAANDMVALAEKQSGFVGIDTARDEGGFGITISYWANNSSAIAWRDHPEHVVIREMGRKSWYKNYSLHVTRVERSYDWSK